jgi:flagellar secretion chaperone FliS
MNDPNFFYREAAVRGANKVRLVVLMYEQIIRDLNRALKAIEQKDIAGRADAINHAITVVGHLQSTLDLDLKQPVVHHLGRFYTMLRGRLLEAHAQVSRQILQEQVSYLLEMREAWVKVEQAESELSARPPLPSAEATLDWKG